MTDRELLEFAALAVGFVYNGYTSTETKLILWGGREWNPLADDGDAFRLAVKLGLFMLKVVKDIPRAEYDKDPYAATRRATVLAAAEIGKSMKGTK